MGKRYECKTRKKAGIKPFCFRGYDKEVIRKSNDYIKLLWKKIGYDLSHRGGISFSVLERLKSEMLQALSVNGFRECLLECTKSYHFMLSAQWRAYIDSLTTQKMGTRYLFFVQQEQINTMQQCFHEFDSKEFDQGVPSAGYLLSRVIPLLEAEAEYHAKKMQSTDGRHLSGDHSHKLTKCIVADKAKPFAAMYTMMNEYSEVVAWWFTTGTGMAELEESLNRLRSRYDAQGFDGPHSFTTDRCCHERAFLERTFRLKSIDDGNESDESTAEAENDGDFEVYEAVSLPSTPKVAYTREISDLNVGEIVEFFSLNPSVIQAVGFDTEYHRGQYKAKCIQIGLPDGRTYVFHMVSICSRSGSRAPALRKSFLENPTIKKVGCRVHNDVKSVLNWDIAVKGAVELGHVANDRCLTGKAPALDYLVKLLWPGVVLEGKDGTGPRLGDWNRLDEAKIEYAALDAFSAIRIFQRLMQIEEEKKQCKLLVADVVEGLPITIYARGSKRRIAEVTLIGRSKVVGLQRHVRVQLDLDRPDGIYIPGTMIDLIQDDDNETTRHVAISELQLESGGTGKVSFDWPIFACRHATETSSSDPIQINSTERRRPIPPRDQPQYDADDDELRINRADSDSSLGENDVRPQLPRNLRRRLRRLKVRVYDQVTICINNRSNTLLMLYSRNNELRTTLHTYSLDLTKLLVKNMVPLLILLELCVTLCS
jgi:hypothetical protein